MFSPVFSFFWIKKEKTQAHIVKKSCKKEDKAEDRIDFDTSKEDKVDSDPNKIIKSISKIGWTIFNSKPQKYNL